MGYRLSEKSRAGSNPAPAAYGWVSNSPLARRFFGAGRCTSFIEPVAQQRQSIPCNGKTRVRGPSGISKSSLARPSVQVFSTGRRIGLSLHKREVAGSSPAFSLRSASFGLTSRLASRISKSVGWSSSGVERVPSQFVLYPSYFYCPRDIPPSPDDAQCVFV